VQFSLNIYVAIGHRVARITIATSSLLLRALVPVRFDVLLSTAIDSNVTFESQQSLTVRPFLVVA